MTNFSKRALLLCGSLLAFAASAQAAEIAMAANSTGKNLNFIRERLAEFEKQSGHKVKLVTMPPSSSEQFSQYRLWLAAGNTDVDVYQTDIVWAPHLPHQFVDLTAAGQGRHWSALPIRSRVANRGRQACGHADVHRCAGNVLSQGSARQIRQAAAEDLERDGRDMPRKFRTRNVQPARRICGASCSRAALMKV